MWRAPPAGVDHIGRYRVLAEIGRGGMGAVFLATSERPEGFCKLFAIKTVLPQHSDERFAAMLLDEARLASRLEHPSIAQVIDVELDEGSPYVVMEYVHGESLASVLQQGGGPLPYYLAAQVVAEIADALDYAHRLEDAGGRRFALVHRDVSPQNILLGYNGVPKLIDFGIASGQGRSIHTDPGVVKGRRDYMPPEQRRGGPVDGRTDVFALGLVLLDATGGGRARGASPNAPSFDPRMLPDDYPSALADVVRRATVAEPDGRFASARAMYTALQNFLAAAPVGSAGRNALADYLHAAFAERRAAKEAMMNPELGAGTTEILASPAGATAAPGRSHFSPDARPFRWIAGLAVASSVLVGATSAILSPAGDETDGAHLTDRVCLLASSDGLLENRDATWTAVRLVGIALDGAPAPILVHGYRAQDRYGWNADGTVRARQACLEAGARDVVVIAGNANGNIEAAVDGDGTPLRATGPQHDAARDIATMLTQHWSGDAWSPPVLDERLDASALDLREPFLLQREDARTYHPGSASHEHSSFEEPYLWLAIQAWWSGVLTRDGPLALRRPPAPSDRFTVLFEAVVDLSRGEHDEVADRLLSLLEDGRYGGDPIAVYLAAEAVFHGTRPREGERLFERVLEIDPQFMPAAYHVFERRLADGDWSRATAEADRWRRIDPSDSHSIEYAMLVDLGRGEYSSAQQILTQLLDGSRVDALDLRVPEVALVWARALSGDVDGALEHALRVSRKRGPRPELAHVSPEPAAYALALWGGDEAVVEEWETRYRALIGTEQTTPNEVQLAYVAAILDSLAGRPDARERWLAGVHPDDVDKSYRFEAQRWLFEGLAAHAAGDAATLRRLAETELAPAVTHLLRALVHRLDGAESAERAELESALAATRSGEFDCIAAAWLAQSYRRQHRNADAQRVCERVLHPYVPRPYCFAVRSTCDARSHERGAVSTGR